MTDLKDCIAALKAEILELRSTVQELSSKVEAAEIENRKAEPSWSQVVRRGKKRQQKQRQGPQPARQTLDPTRQGDKTRKSVKAVGARKIWGTLKTTTSAAVKNALLWPKYHVVTYRSSASTNQVIETQILWQSGGS